MYLKATEEEIIAKLYEFAGNVSMSASELGMTPQALYLRRKDSPAIAQAVIDARRQLVDSAEAVIKHHLEKNNLTAAIYTAKTQGRSRGWDEQPQHKQPSLQVGSITINLHEVDPPPPLPAGDLDDGAIPHQPRGGGGGAE